MATLCGSTACRASWIGVEHVFSLKAAYDFDPTKLGAGPAGLADWLCSTDGTDYCLLGTNDLDSFSASDPTEADLVNLCDGGCKDFYFDFLGSKTGADDTALAESL
eukprot:2730029-Rhodomonas_salina.1